MQYLYGLSEFNAGRITDALLPLNTLQQLLILPVQLRKEWQLHTGLNGKGVGLTQLF